MYTTYIMRRTQIYLTKEQGRLLESQSKATGTTVSQLIRAAVDSVYSRRRAMTRAQAVRLARSAAGSWKAFPETGEEYVERIRGSRRLAQLHGAK
jgi:myosin heavy subunit